MREAHVECGLTAHNFNQRKVNIKKISVAVEKSSTKERHNDLGYSEDDSDNEAVENTP